MKAGTIESLSKSRRLERRGVVLESAWVHRQDSASWVSPTGSLSVDTGRATLEAAGDAPVLLTVGDSGARAVGAAARLGLSGARVYVLAEPGWTAVGTPLETAPHVLVRRVPEVLGSGVVQRGSGTIWCGDAPTWRLTLSGSQCEAFRQFFLRSFWYEAVEEAWGPDFHFRTAAPRPFDVPPVRPDASIRSVPSSHQLVDGGATHALVNEPLLGDCPSLRRVWTPPTAVQTGPMRKQARAGCSVTWDDCGLPNAATDGREGTLLVGGGANRLRVSLSPDQAEMLFQVLDGPAAWSFETDLEIGHYEAKPVKFWLAGEPGAAELRDDVLIEAEPVAPRVLREVPEAEPGDWPAPPALALSVIYGWKVVPPSVPSGAQDDPLVRQWRNVDRDWRKRLAVVREALDGAGGLRTSIGKAFHRLMGSLMGFERDETKLLAKLGELEVEEPSRLGPEGANQLLERLARLEEAISKLHVDLEAARKKAREDEAREQQEAQWKRSVATAREELSARRVELGEACNVLEVADADLKEVTAALANEEDKKAKKDLRARKNKLEDERKAAERLVQQLESKIEALEATVAEPFVFKLPAVPGGKKQKTKKGGRFVPSAPKKVIKAIPEDALPSVGVLRKHKGKRFLVIEDWSELEQGEAEASRLEAQLVAAEAT